MMMLLHAELFGRIINLGCHSFGARSRLMFALYYVNMHTREGAILWAAELREATFEMDGFVQRLLRTCSFPSLQQVTIRSAGGCMSVNQHTVSDESFAALVRGIRKLTHVDLQRCTCLGTMQSLRALAEQKENLTHVVLAQNHGLTDDMLSDFTEQCRNIIYVNLERCTNLTELGTLKLAHHCMSLTHVNLSSCEGINDEALGNLVCGCKLLEYVDLAGCKKVSDIGISTLARGSEFLRDLSIARNKRVSHAGIMELAHYCKALTSINLESCVRMNNKALCHLAAGCKFLEHVDLTGCTEVGNIGISMLAVRCSSLRYLSIASNGRVHNKALVNLAENCPLLTHVDLSGCWNTGMTSKGIKAIGTSCAALTFFNVSGSCEGLHSEDVKEIARNCPNLTDIGLGTCTDIDNEALEVLLRECPKITHIDLQACWSIREDGMIALANFQGDLESVVLGRTFITQSQLLMIATKNFGTLRVLHVQSTDINDDETMVKVATTCTRLEDVDMSTDPEDGMAEMSAITDETLKAFSTCCKELQFVSCRNACVTHAGVILLAKHCVRLRVVDVRYCVQVNSTALHNYLQSELGSVLTFLRIELYGTSNEA